MPNFPKNLKDATEKELNDWINQNDPHYASLASEELTRRKFTEFDKSTNSFSRVLGFFAVIQIIIAIMQFILGVQSTYKDFWQQLIVLIIFFAVILVVYWLFINNK